MVSNMKDMRLIDLKDFGCSVVYFLTPTSHFARLFIYPQKLDYFEISQK